ncbi:predicted protein [Botrytis cinerea T4]|uniref:Uncharacterized protein n=1 Tax=Botryotinia fuckeliana (strain T4) TaxID=999810 RepID=G2Y2L7_BOTF4|nr:predicted protein [Botrytis cinerea T4]
MYDTPLIATKGICQERQSYNEIHLFDNVPCILCSMLTPQG